MKKLYIVRHAKSSWKHSSVKDFDRPLKKKGRMNAIFMAEKLLDRGAQIDHIISSSAKRTHDTTLLIAETIGVNAYNITFTKQLYLTTSESIINIVRSVPSSINELMLVAHNPGVTLTVNQLANEHFENIPTTGIACILFDTNSWANISDKGLLGFFIYPKMFKSN